MDSRDVNVEHSCLREVAGMQYARWLCPPDGEPETSRPAAKHERKSLVLQAGNETQLQQRRLCKTLAEPLSTYSTTSRIPAADQLYVLRLQVAPYGRRAMPICRPSFVWKNQVVFSPKGSRTGFQHKPA